MLSTPSERRERILMMGPFGSGKTTSWLNIALWSHRTGSDAHFYALDSDNALEAFVDSPTYGHLFGSTVTYQSVFEFPEYESALNRYRPLVRPHDWVIVDFMSPVWDAVQSHYIAEIFKEDSAGFFLEARKAAKGGTNPLDGWKDWSVINRLYKGFTNTLIHHTGGHKFLTAMSEPIRDTDDKNLRAMFGAHGVRPKGQKELGFLPHTILHTQVVRPGEVFVTTIKDREREPLQNVQVNDFTLDYLVKVGGWSL